LEVIADDAFVIGVGKERDDVRITQFVSSEGVVGYLAWYIYPPVSIHLKCDEAVWHFVGLGMVKDGIWIWTDGRVLTLGW
jgi:hypothetical protein